MSAPRSNPHTLLGEGLRSFAVALEEISEKLGEVELGRDADEKELARATGELREASTRLEGAQHELGREMEELRELLEAERVRYRDLFEWAPDAYLVTDPSAKILEANRAAEQLLDRARSLIVGKPVTTLLAQSERRAFRLMLARLPSLDMISDWELEVCRRDRSVLTTAVTVSCMRDRNGEIASLRWLIRDVTERKRIEEGVVAANVELERRVRERTAALEAAHRETDETLARLEAVLDQIPAAIVIADADSERIVVANEHAERLLRAIAGDDATVESWVTLGIRTDGTKVEWGDRPVIRALRSGDVVSGEQTEFERGDGSRGMLEVSAAPVLNSDGKIVAAVAAYWDVTDRERRARAEREFVTNAAHELRTPLAALASAVEVLQAGAKDKPHDRDRFLSHVEQQCNRLQRLVRSLLLLARAQTRQERAETEVLDVRWLLDEIAASAPSDRVHVELRCPPGTGVVANRDLAEQALSNLVSNAVKYAPDGEIVLAGTEENGYVALEVIDAGPGIPADERERVLDRFYRGHENGEADGFGLGLSIASQVAEALNGKLELDTGEAAGTRARLLLPSADA